MNFYISVWNETHLLLKTVHLNTVRAYNIAYFFNEKKELNILQISKIYHGPERKSKDEIIKNSRLIENY